MRKIKIKIKSKEFDSMKSACKFYKIKYMTFRTRLSYGYSVEQALTKELKNNKQVVIGSKKFKNRATAARELGINPNTVKSRLNSGKGLKEALLNPKILAGEQFRLPINKDFFEKIDKKEKAYFLGLMFTDGWLFAGNYKAKNKKINEASLGLIYLDKHILESFKNYLGSKYKLSYRKEKKRNYKDFTYTQRAGYTLRIRNQKIVDDLIDKGIAPRKTFDIEFPKKNKIPKILISNFIRGVFDGDGSISKSLNKQNNQVFRQVHFTGGSFIFLDHICKILFEKKITKRLLTPKLQKVGGKTYRIVFSNKDEIKKFKDYIYLDSDETIRLKRKYEKFID